MSILWHFGEVNENSLNANFNSFWQFVLSADNNYTNHTSIYLFAIDYRMSSMNIK